MVKAGTVKTVARRLPKLAFNFTGTRDKEGNLECRFKQFIWSYMGNRAVLDADYMYEVCKVYRKTRFGGCGVRWKRIYEIPSLKKIWCS